MTDPVPTILDRGAVGRPPLSEILPYLADCLDELTSYGTHIFAWCNDSLKDRSEEVLPRVMLLRHFLELLDAISSLVRSSVADPCALLLRGCLETLLQTEYLHESDSDRRSRAFLICELHRRLAQLQEVDPNTPSGRELRTIIKKDRAIGGTDFPSSPDLPNRIATLERDIQLPQYREVEAEFRNRLARGRPPKWYSFFDGPKNIAELAARVRLAGLYRVFYRDWSGLIHGTDILEGRILGKKGEPVGVLGLRQPIRIQRGASHAMTMALQIYRLYVTQYLPERERDYGRWYVRDVKERFLRVSTGGPLLRIEGDRDT